MWVVVPTGISPGPVVARISMRAAAALKALTARVRMAVGRVNFMVTEEVNRAARFAKGRR